MFDCQKGKFKSVLIVNYLFTFLLTFRTLEFYDKKYLKFTGEMRLRNWHLRW